MSLAELVFWFSEMNQSLNHKTTLIFITRCTIKQCQEYI